MKRCLVLGLVIAAVAACGGEGDDIDADVADVDVVDVAPVGDEAQALRLDETGMRSMGYPVFGYVLENGQPNRNRPCQGNVRMFAQPLGRDDWHLVRSWTSSSFGAVTYHEWTSTFTLPDGSRPFSHGVAGVRYVISPRTPGESCTFSVTRPGLWRNPQLGWSGSRFVFATGHDLAARYLAQNQALLAARKPGKTLLETPCAFSDTLEAKTRTNGRNDGDIGHAPLQMTVSGAVFAWDYLTNDRWPAACGWGSGGPWYAALRGAATIEFSGYDLPF